MLKLKVGLFSKLVFVFLIGTYSVSFNKALAETTNLKASLALIPFHSEVKNNTPVGGFVDIVKLIEREIGSGEITIGQFPFARSISNVLHSHADFHLPLIKPDKFNGEKPNFIYVDEAICQVTFVLYTLDSREDITPASASKYQIETTRGHKQFFNFKIGEVNDLEMAMNKLLLGRIDGFIFEQDAVDAYLKNNQVSGVKRQFYKSYDSSIIVPNTDKGHQAAQKLSRILKSLKAQGKLQKITNQIHRPYDDWQTQ